VHQLELRPARCAISPNPVWDGIATFGMASLLLGWHRYFWDGIATFGMASLPSLLNRAVPSLFMHPCTAVYPCTAVCPILLVRCARSTPSGPFFCWQVYRQVTHAAGARYVECLYDYDVTATATTNFLVDLRWLKGCLSAHNVTPS
jgi:hypothetical protein